MLAFAHIQKTGGTTVVGLLRRNFGPLHCDVEPIYEGSGYYRTTYSAADHRWTRRVWPGLQSIAGHRVRPHSDLASLVPDIRYHTWVRDPLKRAASHHQHAVTRLGYDAGFQRWRERTDMVDVMCWHLGGTGRFEDAAEVIERTDTFVGVLECFDESLVLLRDWVGKPRLDIRYERRNVASDDSIRKGLLSDPDARAVLESMNREDIKLYRWIVDEWLPRKRERYGARLAEDVAALRAAPERRRTWSLRELGNRAVRNAWYKPTVASLRATAGRPSATLS